MDFDRFSGNYNEILNRNIRISGESSEYFIEYKVKTLNSFYVKNKLNANGKILDVGCGIGNLEKYLATYLPKFKVYGIDPSAESIHVAQSTNKSCVFSIYDGETIPFQDNHFNAIILSNVLHHIIPAKRNKILKEIQRV